MKSFFKNTLESRIRFRAVVAFVVIAILSVLMIAYIKSLSKTISQNQRQMRHDQNVLSIAGDVIAAVNLAQSDANSFITTRLTRYYSSFQTNVLLADSLIGSLVAIAGNDGNMEMLPELTSLLREKGDIIYRFSNRINGYNPMDTLARRLEVIERSVVRDTVTVTKVVSDTTVKVTQPRNFWGRVSAVFSPEKSADTLVSVAVTVDTLKQLRPDTLPDTISEIRDIAHEERERYTRQVNRFQRELNSLLATDQEISIRISAIVDKFYRQVMEATLLNIEQTGSHIRRNYYFSFAGGITSLLLILTLILFIIRDVNKGYAARKALEEANDRIREIMDSRHKLLLSMSHDIKTPLNSIIGYTSLWSHGHKVDKDGIKSVSDSGRYINALVANVLDFSGLERGNITIVENEFSLKDFIDEVCGMFRPVANSKHLEFNIECQFPEGVWLRADEMKIKQVLVNILSNAFKYTLEGSVSLEVCLNNNLSLKVTDTGAGIADDKLDLVFQPFSRIEGSSSLSQGHGVGMYVVKGFVELLGGDIQIRSEEGSGTQVGINIPVKESFLREVSEITKIETGVPSGGYKIVVFDDDAVFLKVVCDMLEALGHNPRGVSVDGKEIDFSVMTSCDMVLTDMEMGELSGRHVAEQVRKLQPAAPVVLMTGGSQANGKDFDSVLKKPFSLEELKDTISQVFETLYDLTDLQMMYEGDTEGMNDLLHTFIETTKENIGILCGYMEHGDYDSTQAVCHRMLPMFAQIKARRVAEYLRVMDAGKGEYQEGFLWKELVERIVRQSLILIEHWKGIIVKGKCYIS